MLVPGDDLLALALDVIDPQIPTYLSRFFYAEPKRGGQVKINYDEPVQIRASVQAVNAQAYLDLNLDRAKKYITVYSSTPIRSVARDQYGDVIIYNGRRYRAQQDLDWVGQDGWGGVVCVNIPDDADRKTICGDVYG